MLQLEYLVFVGAVASLIGISAYIWSTLRGQTKPNKMSWLMWSIAPLIATCAAIADGVGWSALPVFMSGFGPLLVFLFSFANKKSYWKLEKLDYVCGTFSALALVLWYLTNNPNIAIIFAILSDGSAAIPTVIKSWRYPETENSAPFLTGLFSASTSFAAIQVWNFAALAFPIYLVGINICIITGIYHGKKTKQALN